jgi:RHS repeat-associated protein
MAPSFTGRTQDASSGLQYNRDRYYNPITARFLTQDPTAQATDANVYSYAGSDPVNASDPSGDETLLLMMMVMAVAPEFEFAFAAEFAADEMFTVAAEEEVAFSAEAAAADDGAAAFDPAARRVTMRKSTKSAIQDAAPKTSDGDFVDPNTGQTIPKEGPFDYGHKPGYEWWRTQQAAREGGWSRQDVIEFENDPSHYQIEDPSANRSHRYELK